MIIKELSYKLESLIPVKLALSFDNVGLLIGNQTSQISAIYVALDINEDVIDRAIELESNTIINHHPIIFNPIKNLSQNYSNLNILKCIQNNINVLCYHTNLDAINFGMNDELVKILGFDYNNIEILESNSLDNNAGIGRIVELKNPISIESILGNIRENLYIKNMRIVNNSNKDNIRKICIINGSGNSLIKQCYGKLVDLVITGDTTYHTAFEAYNNNLSIIDIGHFNSENIVYLNTMRNILNKLNISSKVNVFYDDVLKDVYRYV